MLDRPVSQVVRYGRQLWRYDAAGRVDAVQVPARSRRWCVEHDAPFYARRSWTERGSWSADQCVRLARRPEPGDLPGDCQIVPNLILEAQ